LPEISLPEASDRVAGLESLLGQSQRLWESVGSAPLPEWKDLASRFKEAVRGDQRS